MTINITNKRGSDYTATTWEDACLVMLDFPEADDLPTPELNEYDGKIYMSDNLGPFGSWWECAQMIADLAGAKAWEA